MQSPELGQPGYLVAPKSFLTEYPVDDRGFSLIELIVVMAIAGILLGVAVFSMQGVMEGYKVRGAARQLYSDMQMARLSAIKGGRNWALCFTPGTPFTSYSIRNTPGADGNLCTSDDPTSGPTPFFFRTVDISAAYKGMAFAQSFSGNNVEFMPNGTASSGNVTITNGTRTVQVTVNGSTGNIRIP